MTLELTDVALTAPSANRPLFAPLTLAVAPGEILALTGPSGIGKSSLLAAIGGHLAPGFRLAGRIRLDGRDLAPLPAEARQVGMIFQQAQLFAHLSVGGNLAFGLRPGLRGRSARRAAVAQALAEAGLAGFETRDPATLSGGQRARVALLRALLAAPRALLLDEPFASLDPPLRAGLRALLRRHVTAAGIPALIVSHDAEDAQAADRTRALHPFGTG